MGFYWLKRLPPGIVNRLREDLRAFKTIGRGTLHQWFVREWRPGTQELKAIQGLIGNSFFVLPGRDHNQLKVAISSRGKIHYFILEIPASYSRQAISRALLGQTTPTESSSRREVQELLADTQENLAALGVRIGQQVLTLSDRDQESDEVGLLLENLETLERWLGTIDGAKVDDYTQNIVR